MVKMIATKPLTYDMKTIEADEEFEVADAYVGTLTSLGRARLKDDPKGSKVKPTTTRQEPDDESGEDTGAKYRTRQVKAKDD
jgi:hypothetical protein